MPQDKQILEAVIDKFRSATPRPMVPPPPTIFQADPPIVGDRSFARLAQQLLDLEPHTKTRVRGIYQGPTIGSIREMVRSGLRPEMFGGTTLLGVHSPRERVIGVNPEIDPLETYLTLIHELGHAAGMGERAAQDTENLFTRK